MRLIQKLISKCCVCGVEGNKVHTFMGQSYCIDCFVEVLLNVKLMTPKKYK